MTQPPRIMVDTNVWVSSYCGWHTGWADARRFLRVALQNDAVLLFPVHCAKDVLYVLTHEFKRKASDNNKSVDEQSARAASAAAMACVRNLEEIATPVGADTSDLWLAHKYLQLHNDFEDDLVLAACKRAQADFLVSADVELLEHADVAGKTPAQMAAILELG